MSHEFESGYVVGTAAWHQLATVKAIAPPTVEEAQREAGLDWTVRRDPVFLNDDGFIGAQVPDGFAVIRESDGAVLGLVGGQWRPVQNTALFNFFRPFVDSGRMTIDTAGSLKGGKAVWAQGLVCGAGAEVVPGDKVQNRLLVANGHDGRLKLSVKWTNMRTVCANTLSAALAGGGAWMAARHTKNVNRALEIIQSVLDIAERDFDVNISLYRRMADYGLTSSGFRAYVRQVFEVPEDVEKMPRAWNRLEPLFEDTAQGLDIPGVRGTLWGGYNAVTEYIDHHATKDAGRRLSSAWFGQGAVIRDRARELAVQMVG
jgi:phage/plasmid-like protein (TIGR03299 family)